MRKENIVASVVLIIIFIELIAVPINSMDYVIGRLQNNAFYNIDWETMYPYEDEREIKQDNLVEKYKNLSAKVTRKIETIANTYSICRNDVVELYGYLNKCLGIKIVKDSEISTVALRSDYLNYIQKRNTYIENTIEDIIFLNNYVEERNMNFIYMQAPSKLFSEEDIVLGCIDNYTNEDKTTICDRLTFANVDVFDVREYMPSDYDSYMSWFYRTDHHWKVESGLYIASLLAQRLNEYYGFQINLGVFDKDKFNVKTYPKGFLGTEGRKFTLGYVSPDDFNLLTPIEIQDFSIDVPRRGIQETGGFDVMLNKEFLEINDLYKADRYNTYIYGDEPYIRIVNNKSDVNKKILMISDSYSEAVIPFLALDVKLIDRIDLRLFSGSLKTFLDNNQYDVVILLVSTAGEKYDVDTHNSMWDFR